MFTFNHNTNNNKQQHCLSYQFRPNYKIENIKIAFNRYYLYDRIYFDADGFYTYIYLREYDLPQSCQNCGWKLVKGTKFFYIFLEEKDDPDFIFIYKLVNNIPTAILYRDKTHRSYAEERILFCCELTNFLRKFSQIKLDSNNSKQDFKFVAKSNPYYLPEIIYPSDNSSDGRSTRKMFDDFESKSYSPSKTNHKQIMNQIQSKIDYQPYLDPKKLVRYDNDDINLPLPFSSKQHKKAFKHNDDEDEWTEEKRKEKYRELNSINRRFLPEFYDDDNEKELPIFQPSAFAYDSTKKSSPKKTIHKKEKELPIFQPSSYSPEQSPNKAFDNELRLEKVKPIFDSDDYSPDKKQKPFRFEFLHKNDNKELNSFQTSPTKHFEMNRPLKDPIESMRKKYGHDRNYEDSPPYFQAEDNRTLTELNRSDVKIDSRLSNISKKTYKSPSKQNLIRTKSPSKLSKIHRSGNFEYQIVQK